MKDILKEAINEAEKIGRLRKPYYSQGMTHEEAVNACEELLERTHEKLKNFISVNNCVISSVCDHPFNSLDIDKKLLHHFCNKCGKYVYKQNPLGTN